ncbi:phage tail protein [Actinokineospora cianjurensis]|nr:hypothetical protein [Actinokineospora cianjurensis]
MSVAHVRRLQRSVGNRAATKALGRTAAVQRLESPPETVTRPTAEADPRFASVEADVRGKQKQVAAHPPAAAEASAAQAAAVAPPDDKLAQGKAANAEKMNAAKPGEFDKAGFVRAVEQAIAAQAPKNLAEADDFGGSGKADAVKGQVRGQVTAGKQASAGPIESTTNAPPDTAAATEKPVTPLAPDRPPGAPAAPDAAKAVPEKAPASATDFSAGPKQVDGDMAAAGITEDQLAKSNEPEFTGALQEKKEVEQHAATAPGKVRGAEAETLGEARAAAAGTGAAAMAGLAGERARAGGKVTADKQGAKGKDEARRAQVTATLQKVFDATKTDVEAILSGLDKKVDDAFTAGEKAARDAFTAEHKQKMDAYKDKRYSGFTGKLKWVKDKFAGLPEEANQIFVTARQGYVTRMRAVISSVADVIGGELTRAKTRIASGREQLQAEVRKLPADLQAVGKQAAGELAGKFDELTESVDAKGSELVQTLASKYNEALKSVDAEIDAEKEKNKGLVAKAVGAIKGVIDTILKLKDLLLGILAKAAAAVLGILKDPIGFLGNLVSAVGSGLRAFMANIGEHLKKGLIGWLLGAMAGAGLQLPAKFDLRGIIMMIGSLLGLTWSAIRGRVLSRGVPEPAMAAAEGAVPVAQKLKAEGVGGIWETIKAKTGDLKAGLFGKIAQFLVPTVLIAGITWIISLLNPASAFVKAVKMIIDIVTFIVTQGAQILQFVNAVLDAVVAIAGGGAGGVPSLIEAALATSIPVLIGALAAILGISGIADKVKKIIQSLSKPVMKVVDWVVDKIAGVAKKLWAKLKGKFGKDKGKDRGAPGERPGANRGAGANGAAAIREAGPMLAAAPDKAAAQRGAAEIGRRHQVPLRLVPDRVDATGEVVHIQTSRTGERSFRDPADAELQAMRAALGDVRAQMELDALRTEMRPNFLLRSLKRLAPARREQMLIDKYLERTDARAPGLDVDKLKRKFQRVKSVLDHAIGIERVRRRPECATVLTTMESMAAGLPAIDSRIAAVRRKAEEDVIRAELADMLERASRVAKGHGYPSIESLQHPSDYVLDGEIRSEYPDIRAKFYPSAYSATAHTWAAAQLTALKARAATSGLAPPPGVPLHSCYLCVQGAHLVHEENWTFDHQVPVAKHWTDTGRKSRHSERVRFYSDTSILEIMCGPCNSRKGSSGASFGRNVEPTFRGPNE